MGSKNMLQTGMKYIVPGIFLLFSILLISKGFETHEFDNAVCGVAGVPTESGEVNKTIELERKYEELSVEQTSYFKYAGFTLFLMSVAMILYIGGYIKRTISMVLIPVFIVTSVLMLWFSYDTINEINKFDTIKANIYRETKQRMIDFKEAAAAYKTKYNKYPKTKDELIEFVKEGTIEFVKADNRDVPDAKIKAHEAYILYSGEFDSKFPIEIADTTQMLSDQDFRKSMDKFLKTTDIPWGDSSYTELSAWRLGMIGRDTIHQPVVEKLFTGPDAKRRNSEWKFDPDSLKYVAYTGEEFLYFTRVLENFNEEDSVMTYKHRFELRMPTPMKKDFSDNKCEDREELIMGSLDSDKLSGNW